MNACVLTVGENATRQTDRCMHTTDRYMLGTIRRRQSETGYPKRRRRSVRGHYCHRRPHNLSNDESFPLINSFEPEPLYDILKDHSFEHETVNPAFEEWHGGITESRVQSLRVRDRCTYRRHAILHEASRSGARYGQSPPGSVSASCRRAGRMPCTRRLARVPARGRDAVTD